MSMLDRFLFPAPSPSYKADSFPDELIWIPKSLRYDACSPEECYPALLFQRSNARYFVVYFHSNGEDLGLIHSFGATLSTSLEVHMLLVEYPGYGLCPGQCCESSLWTVARTAFRFITEVLRFPRSEVIIMGRSLGSFLATQLASQEQCRGLILVAPFLSIADAISDFIGARIGGFFVDASVMSNISLMPSIKRSLLVIHGRSDRLIPWTHGQELHRLCPHHDKVFSSPEKLEHNSDLLSSVDYLVEPMRTFFSLPDYEFREDLHVPKQAFDQRHCFLHASGLKQPSWGPDSGRSAPGKAKRHTLLVGDGLRRACGDMDDPEGGPRPEATIFSRDVEAVLPPGYAALDIDQGISRFLQESAEIPQGLLNSQRKL